MSGVVRGTEGRLTIPFDFGSFSDYWSTFTTGQGKTGGIS